MIKKTNIVVAVFERFYFAFNEIVEFFEIARELGRQIEIHDTSFNSSREIITR